MRAEIINPFLIASRKIVELMMKENITLGELILENEIKKDNFHIYIIIQFTGDYNGRIVFKFKKEVAIFIERKISGESITGYTVHTNSIIQEFCELIAGRASAVFAERGISIEMHIPIILNGSSVNIKSMNFDSEKKIMRVPVIITKDEAFVVFIEKKED